MEYIAFNIYAGVSGGSCLAAVESYMYVHNLYIYIYIYIYLYIYMYGPRNLRISISASGY